MELIPIRFGSVSKKRETKTFFTMRALGLLTIFISLTASSQSTDTRISLSVANAPLEQVFKEIKKQSGYEFVYTREQLRKSVPVTLSFASVSLDKVLEACFKEQPFTYTIEGKFIALKDRSENPMPISNKKDISGIVLGENGKPLSDVNITVASTGEVTATDNDGHFSLKNIRESDVLLVSAISYQAKRIPVRGKNYFEIQLLIAINEMDETIIKGYYFTSKRFNTGSVTKVTSKEISKQPVSNPLAAIEGRVPGLFITQGSGLPGSNFTVRLRGQNSIQNGNSPLYIIDGVPFLSDADRLTQRSGIDANSPFNSINPNDIESIEILKDADATAIYGSRGANGVILITTKKAGSAKSKVELNVYAGFGKVTRTMKFMNTNQYLQMRREAFINDNVLPTVSKAPDLLVWDTTRYVDWKKLLIGNTAHSTNSQIRFSGGNTNTRFSLGANYYKETTVFPGNSNETRKSVDLNITHNSADNKFSLVGSSSYAINNSNLIGQDLTQFINLPPNMYQPFDSAGKLQWSEGGVSYGNPLSLIFQTYKGVTDRLSGNAVLTYKLLSSLNLKTSFGYNKISFDETLLFPISSQDPSTNPKGSGTFANASVETWIIEPQVEYNTSFNKKGRLSMLAGSSWQESINKKNLTRGSGYTNDDLLLSLAGAATITASNSYNQYRYQGVFGRINFNWANKYLINATGRRDGSSRFGPGNQYANFGAAGIGWIFSEEKFMKQNIAFLSFGKLKGSYGITGNDQINNYQFLDSWTGTQFPYQGQPSLRPTRLFNPNYKWEQNRKLEASLELGFLNDRILITADYFRNRSDNQIIQYSLPAQTGFSNILLNFPGVVENTGWEFELNTINIPGSDFSWSTSLNLSFNKNKLVAFPGLENSSYATTYIVGQPLNIVRGYQYLGIDTQTGVYQLEDLNRDGVLNSLDFVLLGNTDPKYFGGMGNSMGYRGFQMDVFVQFVKQTGKQAIFSSLITRPGTFGVNEPFDLLNRWQKSGDLTTYQMFTQTSANPAYGISSKVASSSAVLTDASYVRIKNISVSYTLQKKWIQKLKMNNCRIYVQAQNLFTITNYIGGDPETQNTSTLPPLRMITAGIDIAF